MLNLDQEFSKRLKIARASAGVSQKELADALGINKATISRYERLETARILETTVDGMARRLDVNVDYLLGKTNEIGSYRPEKSLSKEENELIDGFRSLNSNGKELVKSNLENVKKVKSLRIGAEFATETLMAASGAENLNEEERALFEEDLKNVEDFIKNMEDSDDSV